MVETTGAQQGIWLWERPQCKCPCFERQVLPCLLEYLESVPQ